MKKNSKRYLQLGNTKDGTVLVRFFIMMKKLKQITNYANHDIKYEAFEKPSRLSNYQGIQILQVEKNKIYNAQAQ
jgi:hypothetical protein